MTWSQLRSLNLNKPIKEIWSSSVMSPIRDDINLHENDLVEDEPVKHEKLAHPYSNQRVNPVRLAIGTLDQLRAKYGMTIGLPPI